MKLFNKNKFAIVYKKFKNYTNQLNISYKLSVILISFRDFLLNFYLDNKLLHKNAIYDNDNYYIIKGINIINEFEIIEFNSYKNFLVNNYTYFDEITTECIYLSNNQLL